MHPRRALAVTLLSFAGAVALAPARAGDPPPFRLEEKVPASTLAFVAVEGFPAGWRAALHTTPLGALLDRPEVEASLRPLVELLRRGLRRADPGEALLAHVAPALGELEGRFELAVVKVWRDGTPEIRASLDFGANLSRFVRFLETVREALPEGWAAQGVAIGASDARELRLSSGSSTWLVRFVGTTVFVNNQVDATVGIPWFANAGWSPLAELPAFIEAFGDPARLDAASIRAYADVGALVTRALDDPSGSVGSKFAAAAGLRAVTTLSYRAAVEDGAVAETLRIGATKAENGAFSLFRTAPIATRAPLLEPRRTWLRLESSLPVSTWPSRWRAFLHDVDAQDEVEFVSDLARWDHVLGADLEAGLLAHVADEQTFSVGLSDGGGAFPDVVLSMPVRDAAAFEPMLVRAVDGFCVDRTEHGDESVTQRTVRAGARALHVIEFRARAGAEGTACSPTWAIVGDPKAGERLVVTLVPHTMRASIHRNLGDDGLRPPFDPPRPHTVEAAVAAARASGTALVVGTRDLLGSAYDTLVPLAETIPSWKRAVEAAGFDPAHLPGAAEASAAWSDTVLSLKVGADGVTLRATSPIGVLPLVALVVASLHAAAAPDEPSTDVPTPGAGEPFASLPASSDDPRRLTSEALDRIARALQEYVALRGAFPATLDELTTTERLLSAVPRDAWDRPLRYTPAGAGTAAIVASAGPDGVFGDDDDVTVDVEAPAK